MIEIDIETNELIEKTKRDKSGRYFVQEGFIHTVGRDGKPNRYPERFEFYAPSGPDGVQKPYTPGHYTISDEAFRVQYGRLELGFLTLTPLSQASKKAS